MSCTVQESDPKVSGWRTQFFKSVMFAASGMGLLYLADRFWKGALLLEPKGGAHTLATSRDLVVISKNGGQSGFPVDPHQKVELSYQRTYSPHEKRDSDLQAALASKIGLVPSGIADVTRRKLLSATPKSTKEKDERGKPGTVKWEFCSSNQPFLSCSVLSDNEIYFNAWNYQSTELYALDRTTGQPVWNISGYELLCGLRTAILERTVDRERVYCYKQGHSDVTALNASTGAQIWEIDENVQYVDASEGAVFTYGQVNHTQSCWFAFNATTGKELWRFPGKESPSVFQDILIGPGRRTWWRAEYRPYVAINASNSELIWEVEIPGLPENTYTTVMNGVVYFFEATRQEYILRLHALDVTTGFQIWSSANHNFSSSSDFATDNINEMVYTNNLSGFLQGINASSGQTLWTSDIRMCYEGGELTAHNGYVYCNNFYNGGMTALNGTTGELLWHLPHFYSSPAFGNRQVYLAYVVGGEDNTWVSAVNPATGKSLWKTSFNFSDTSDYSVAQLIYHDGMLYVSGANGCLYTLYT